MSVVEMVGERKQVDSGGAEIRSAQTKKLTERASVVIVTRILLVAVLLGLWQLFSGRVIPAYIVSSPSTIARTLWDFLTSRLAWSDIEITTLEFLIGFAAGATVGALVGVVLAEFRFASRVVLPLIAAVNGIPKIALAPLFLIVLGLGIWSKVLIAAISVFFILFYNVYSGLIAQPDDLVDVLKIMGATRFTISRRVLLPSVMPNLIAGLRAGVPLAMIGVIVGEWIASNSGVGYYINQQTQQFNTSGAFSGIIVVVVMVLIANNLINLVERGMLRRRSK